MVVTLLDTSESGCRVLTSTPLGVASNVYLDRSAITGTGKPESWRARVIWCSIEAGVAAYTAGLELLEPAKNTAADERSANGPAAVPDHYEILQISAKAQPDMIHRVYRMLAQRLHPDNPDSGDERAFRQLLESYKILSDPELRAAYDAQLSRQNQHKWRIFDQVSALNGRESEKVKRVGMLLVLYTRRRNEPAQPSMSLHEMEDLLGCPKEHLEFGLWYLKEKNFVAKGDNGRFMLTANGVEAAEAADFPLMAANRLMLPGK